MLFGYGEFLLILFRHCIHLLPVLYGASTGAIICTILTYCTREIRLRKILPKIIVLVDMNPNNPKVRAAPESTDVHYHYLLGHKWWRRNTFWQNRTNLFLPSTFITRATEMYTPKVEFRRCILFLGLLQISCMAAASHFISLPCLSDR